MTFTSHQGAILIIGILGFLLGVTSGISFGAGHPAGGGVALVLGAIGWAIVYAVTAGRTRRQ